MLKKNIWLLRISSFWSWKLSNFGTYAKLQELFHVMRSFVVRACSARDLHAHQVRGTVVNLGYNSSILSEWLGIFNRIHLQP